MAETQETSLRFKNPPVVEKLMGVEFSPLDQWGIPLFGLFWQEIRDQYPTYEVQPPIVSPASVPSASVPILDLNATVRCWFFHESKTKLIQVQNSRFVYNWQKPASYEAYPHYGSIRQEFKNRWLQFVKFLKSNGVNPPNVKQCEITYIDHFVRGREWQDLSELPKLINGWSGIKDDFLPTEPDFISIQTAYSMPDGKGRVILQLQPVTRDEDEKEIIQLQITAIGKPASSEIEDLLIWFDVGRDWAVQSFLALTSKEMHELWGKEDS